MTRSEEKDKMLKKNVILSMKYVRIGVNFINDGSIFKVSRVIMWPGMICNP